MGIHPHGAIPLMGCQVWLAPAWWFLPGVTEGPVTAKPKRGLDLWPGRQQPGNPSDMLYIGGGRRKGCGEREWSRSKMKPLVTVRESHTYIPSKSMFFII